MIAVAEQFNVWQRFLEYSYYQHALLGGLAIALLCGVLSVFVVLKRMAFIGQGISHAAFGGVGIALILSLFLESLRPVLARDGVIAIFCCVSAIAIGFMSRRGKMGEDTAIGIVLVATMALGVVLLDIRDRWLQDMLASGQMTRGEIGYAAPNIHNILFGNILLIQWPDIAAAWILAAIVIALTIGLFKELVFFTFDEETASVFGVRTSLLYYGLLLLLGLAIVAAMRSLGVVLASALLVLPGAAARCWSKRIGIVTFISALIGMIGLAAGLFLAIWLKYLSPGPIIVLTFCAIFAISYCFAPARRFRG